VLEYIRYTNRIPITQEFVPTDAEQALYDMVSDYLRRPSLQALPSSQRTLMTLIMRKLLASSTFAIAGALDMARHGIDGHRYRLGHPLAQHIIALAGARKLNGAAIVFDYTAWPQTARAIEPLVGKSGTLVAHKLSVRGSDDQDHIILAAMTDDGARLDPKAALRLFELPARTNGAAKLRLPDAIRQTVQKERKGILDQMAARQSVWFDDEMEKLDNWAEDKRAGLKSDLKDLDEQIKSLKKEIRQTGNLPAKLALQRQARGLETKRDEAWRAYDDAAKEIEVQKDGLLDQVEERLGQSVFDEELFAIRFEIA
jgi:hypothetical protein